MKRSTSQILTTHAGSLPWVGEPAPATEDELRGAVADVVARQRELGLDLINEGEYTKGGDWLSFADDRFAGFESTAASDEKPVVAQGRDREEFDAFYPIPEERVRYHMCWGSWHGPHAHDFELVHLVDILLEVRAQAYLIEGANARHEHEWAVWRDVRLPEGKILVPGVVTHSTDVVEHPDLVAQRIERFASVLGAENVIAGTDCGFGGRSHPQIAWAKLRSLTEGAARASRALGLAL